MKNNNSRLPRTNTRRSCSDNDHCRGHCKGRSSCRARRCAVLALILVGKRALPVGCLGYSCRPPAHHDAGVKHGPRHAWSLSSTSMHQSLSLVSAPSLLEREASAPPSKKTTPSTSPKKKSVKSKGNESAEPKPEAKPKTKRKNKSTNDPTHWVVESDEVLYQCTENSIAPSSALDDDSVDLESSASATSTLSTQQQHSLLQFTVRGNPLPLRRHRTSRGFVYNPSAVSQRTFHQAVEQLVFGRPVAQPYTDDASSAMSCINVNIKETSSDPVLSTLHSDQPLWGPEHVLAVTIVFRMKRPNNHFVGNKRGPNRLRQTAPSQTSGNLRTDVDNLAKFVLDSLNGVLYADDRQIASLHVTKLLDNDMDNLCLGSTCVCIRLLQDKDVPRLLANSLDLY